MIELNQESSQLKIIFSKVDFEIPKLDQEDTNVFTINK